MIFIVVILLVSGLINLYITDVLNMRKYNKELYLEMINNPTLMEKKYILSFLVNGSILLICAVLIFLIYF